MKTRIWLLSLCVILISVILFGLAATQVYYDRSIEDGKSYVKVYMNEFEEEKYPLTKEGATAYSEKLNGARVTFMDIDGKVLADSSADIADVDHSTREEIKKAIESGEGYAVRPSTTLGKNMLYYCKSFDGKYLVRVAIFTDADWVIFVNILPSVLPFLAIMVLLCVIMAVMCTSFILSPVEKLAKDAASGDYVETAYPELKPVVAILNAKTRSINRQMAELKAENKLVEKAQESKDEFISNVTHEMNTPLTSIRGYAELLSCGGLSDEQKAIAYKTIENQSERLTNLIACIINYNEIDSDDLPPYDVDMTLLVKETLYALKPDIDKRGITLKEEIEDDVHLESRHEYLSEIVGNLIRNAIKYNKDNGTLTVILTKNSFTVKDTGIGIAEKDMGKVFSRFFTVDRSHSGKNGGFGLGLAVVKKICNKSGYDITLESELNVGSTFTVTFNN